MNDRQLIFAYHSCGDLTSRVRASDYVVSMRNVACCVCSNPAADYNYYLLLAAKVRCHWCVCVLSSPWWSGLAKP